MSGAARWDDLAPRVLSGAAMGAAGLLCAGLGGLWFQLLVALACGAMLWELWRMLDPSPEAAREALAAAAATGLLLLSVRWLGALALVPLLLPAGAVWLRAPRLQPAGALYALAICAGGYGLIHLRGSAGLVWLLWLLLVVVATDIAGYFAGRALGGPRFWPAVSPKKTWSGTVAGWIAAALVGLVFALSTPAGTGLVLLSVLVSFAGQMGDIAESALKRACGVKDSSRLIPGHGGVMDRFDALIGATLAVLAVALVSGLPDGA